MGWTSYRATYYKNGTVDRKAECDSYFLEGLNRGHFNIVASSLIGSTYYAAIQPLKKGEKINGEYVYTDIPDTQLKTIGIVMLTSVNTKDYHNFSYKIIEETSGPFKYDCPMKILNLLTTTESEWANEWRNKCREHHKSKRRKTKRLEMLPVGAIIKFEWKGKEIIAKKKPAAYQFKKPWYKICGDDCYIKIKNIPDDFEVIN